MEKYTKRAIMGTFLDMLEYKSLDKITVKDIIEKEEINRNTFYYYFKDIYDLIDQIFEAEMKRVLSEMDETSTFEEEYKRVASILIQRKHAIEHIYHSKSKEILRTYIEKTTGRLVECFVRKEAEGSGISEKGIQFVTFFYSSAIIGNSMHWLEEGMPSYRSEFLHLVSTSFASTVKVMIKNYIETEQI